MGLEAIVIDLVRQLLLDDKTIHYKIEQLPELGGGLTYKGPVVSFELVMRADPAVGKLVPCYNLTWVDDSRSHGAWRNVNFAPERIEEFRLVKGSEQNWELILEG